MFSLDSNETLFIFWAFFLETGLILHFALRTPFLETHTHTFGWLAYVLTIPGGDQLDLALSGKALCLLDGRDFIPQFCCFWNRERLPNQ